MEKHLESLEEHTGEVLALTDEVTTHMLQEEWEIAHEKALILLQKEPESIEAMFFVIMSSAHGGFFQDAIDYGKKALLWAENHGNDTAGLNFFENAKIEIREYIARGYFGIGDYLAAAAELDKIKEIMGQLPDSTKQFAIKNENMLNGAASALDLAEQLDKSFTDRKSEDFYAFKIAESWLCMHEITTSDSPENLQVAQAQKMARYLLRLFNCLENVDENYLNENNKDALKFGEEWLARVSVVLYQGESADKYEMETNNHYPAAEECIMVLDKLASLGNGPAQKMLGNVYTGGFNVEKDDEKAFKYYKQAYENGEESALLNLACYYNEGVVVEKDSNRALEYAKKAVEAGVKNADSLLGQIYADSLGDIEQGLVWLKKACANGDEIAKNILLRLGRENVDGFDDKLQFILDINKKVGSESDIDSLSSQLELGRKYVEYYMEIEHYYIAPLDRLFFITFCMSPQPEILMKNGGFVSVNYFTDQFEKVLQEMADPVRRIQWIRIAAKKADDLNFGEFTQAAAAGQDLTTLGWSSVCDYIYDRFKGWGWDGYMEDGKKWNYIHLKEEIIAPTKSNASETSYTHNSTSSSGSNSSEGCYVATAVYGSYDCPEVWTLRRFRDLYLSQSWYGRAFIRIYYVTSPTLVKFFGETGWFKHFWKNKLDKWVISLKHKGYSDRPYSD